jgi:hypothetical protein
MPEEKKNLLADLHRMQELITMPELTEILNSTIRHDEKNKVITFLGMLLTYTEEDQINVSYIAESSTGKSYIPLELAWYFPEDDVLEYSYVSPTAFFHEYGVMLPDPTDKREGIEEEKRRKIVVINLHQKILIFIDQPHDMLLQRLRPLLSHDRKTLACKITDRRERSGLRTKTVLIEGFPTVLFCSAKPSQEDQERTRMLLLSPETSQQKLKDSILLKIEKESNREAFKQFMEENPQRLKLKERVSGIRTAHIEQIVISETLREQIAQQFFKIHGNLIPRHQRDIGRLLGLIKAVCLLNLWQREQENHILFVNEEDVQEGFRLYSNFSAANELGLPPEVFNIYIELKPMITENGVTRKEFQTLYYQVYRRTLGKKRLDEILNLLQSVGLFTEEPDPNDHRLKRWLPTCQGVYIIAKDTIINTPEGVGKPTEPSTCWICHGLIGGIYESTPEGAAHVHCWQQLLEGRENI